MKNKIDKEGPDSSFREWYFTTAIKKISLVDEETTKWNNRLDYWNKCKTDAMDYQEKPR